MSDTLIAYLAGIIDGEGSVFEYAVKDRPTKRFIIRVEMTDRRIPDLLSRTFGNQKVHMRDRSHKPGRANEKPTYTWIVSGSKARAVYEILKEHLIIKRNFG